MPARTVPSPLGPLTVIGDDAITALRWAAAPAGTRCALLDRAAEQLQAYFAGGLDRFDLPLAPCGTRHERAVWTAMQAIPFGATLTYGAVAAAVRSSPRAVGNACGRNPIPIIIPCHRVVGANSAIGGYSGYGGADTKRFLLELEGGLLPLSPR